MKVRRTQRFGPLTINGFTHIGVIKGTLGATGVLIKIHSGSGAGSSLPPGLFCSGDGVNFAATGVNPNGGMTSFPTNTLAEYNATEAAGNWQYFTPGNAATVFLGKIPFPNLRLTLNSSTVTGVIVDVFVLFEDSEKPQPSDVPTVFAYP